MRGTRSRNMLIALACVVLIALGMPGGAATPPSAVLSDATSVVEWAGITSGGAGYNPPAHTPQTCAVAAKADLCDSFSLALDLPEGTYAKPGDGLFIAVRWATDFDQWNLFVYGPKGSLVKSAFDLDSTAQAVLIPQAPNGVYTIVVVPFYMEKMTYRGEARVFLDDTQRHTTPTPLLPQLETVPPFDFHVACSSFDPTSTNTNGGCPDVPPVPSNPTGWRWGGGYGNSCYLDETVQAAVRGVRPLRCLRFSNDIHNVGGGPLRLRLSLSDAIKGIAQGPCRVHQVIEVADGTEGVRDAGACIFHRAHGHFHTQGFASYALYAAPAANATTAPDLSQPALVRGAKVGYCLIDVDFYADLHDPTTIWPRTNYFPNCNIPTQASANASAFQEMGISRGWGDIYTWDLPGQFIDITGIPDGTYDVVSIANPLCLMAEAAPGKEMAITRIALDGADVHVVGSFGPYPVPGCVPPTE